MLFFSCHGVGLQAVSKSGVVAIAVGSVDGRVALQVSSSSNSNDISVSGAFVTGDDEGYATIWDA
ncbi:hypothetical protein TSUD_243400 [Trifolium subterraneum]|uniref:Uncharacterized protein n=1 Tax=Trifolium subterraneum TaxID=3900 RepID=A0A2Z6PJG3_TRISU|nr:hypothetical protein TSUD_243400 [Trifolium subterraneum]